MPDPLVILAWMELVTTILTTLADIGQRLQGGNVTPEELERLKAETKAAIARWDAAAVFDKPDKEN